MREYLIVCTSPYLASDGTTQPVGTAINRVMWDGVTPYSPGLGLSLVPDDGRTIYQPAMPVPTTIGALAFIERFPPATLAPLMAANPVWGVLIAASQTINVTDPTLLGYMHAAVASGALTQAQMTQVLDLSIISP